MFGIQRGIDKAKTFKQVWAWVERYLAEYAEVDIDELIADCPVDAPEGLIREIVEAVEAENE